MHIVLLIWLVMFMRNEIDLNDNNEVLNFIEKEVYSLGHSKKCEIEVVKETENLHNKQIKNINKLFLLIRETIIDVDGEGNIG